MLTRLGSMVGRVFFWIYFFNLLTFLNSFLIAQISLLAISWLALSLENFTEFCNFANSTVAAAARFQQESLELKKNLQLQLSTIISQWNFNFCFISNWTLYSMLKSLHWNFPRDMWWDDRQPSWWGLGLRRRKKKLCETCDNTHVECCTMTRDTKWNVRREWKSMKL